MPATKKNPLSSPSHTKTLENDQPEAIKKLIESNPANSANIRLDEDVLKTSWRRFSSSSSEDVLKTSSRCLHQDEYIALIIRLWKTTSRRLDQDQYIRLGHTSSRPLHDVFKTSYQDVFKTFSRNLQDLLQKRFRDIFKMSSRRFEDLFKTSSRRLQNFFKTSCKSVLKTSSRRLQDVLKISSRRLAKMPSRRWRIIRFNCLPRSRICLGHTFEKFMVSVENLQLWYVLA